MLGSTGLLAAGCSDDGGDTGPPGPTEATDPDSTSTSSTTEGDDTTTSTTAPGEPGGDPGAATGELPAGFPGPIPFPDGTTVESASETVADGDVHHHVAFTVDGPASDVFEDVLTAFEAADFDVRTRSGNTTNDVFTGTAEVADGDHAVSVNVRSTGAGNTIASYFVGPAPG